ncbi:hypothetical protein BDZ97DRAFT_1121982 [Flammula alnicola]|nr:hypothetical protein BDZ97DRAFT_1121982 [Flammula alnicola]
MSTLVHLVYIHGFQGNDTTFQSFPKHLQEHLATRIPQHLDVTIQSSLYPTYKSVKPISYATKNFLEWLSTQPPGPVILMGHSMGGLLAAEAATDASNNPERYPGGRPKRIVGVVAFDTPYLGMHPHVVITGIASLLPKGDDGSGDKKGKSESAMNVHPQVNIVDEKVTEDWDAFKKQMHVHPRHAPYASDSKSTLSPSHSQETLGSLSNLSLSPNPSSTPEASAPSPFVDRALSFIAARNDEPLVRWLRKHADEPFSAGKRWVVERFQFGICMFDPSGLKSRYTRLVEWETEGGLWINYWTNTVPRIGSSHVDAGKNEPSPKVQQIDNDEALTANGILPESEASSTTYTDADPSPTPSDSPLHTAPTKSETKAAQKEADKQLKLQEKQFKQEEKSKIKALKQQEKEKSKKNKTERHFVILPNGLGQVLGGMEKWENVPIGGVEDEVNAHTGLFMPQQNLEYELLVDRVANRILGWCERLPKVEGGGKV